MLVGGAEDVYLYGKDEAGKTGATCIVPVRDDEQWCLDSMRPLSGDFTVPSDRQRLVDPILGLWATVLQSHAEGERQCELVYRLIQEHHDEVFPPEYFGELITLLEERYRATEPQAGLTEEASYASSSRRSLRRPGSLLATLRRGRRQHGRHSSGDGTGRVNRQVAEPVSIVSSSGSRVVEVEMAPADADKV